MRPIRFLVHACIAAALVVGGAVTAAGPAAGAAQAPTGSFLYPSPDGPGTIISSANNGTDSTYRFSVRTDPAPGTTIAAVQIQIDPPGSAPWMAAGSASRAGSSDTWELAWDEAGAGVGDGDGAVRAMLTGSDGSIAYVPGEDGQAVTFAASAPTASLTQGGRLGF